MIQRNLLIFRYVPTCYCDRYCPIYEDCCYEYTSMTHKTEDEQVDERTQRLINESVCHPFAGRIDFGIYLVSSCPGTVWMLCLLTLMHNDLDGV